MFKRKIKIKTLNQNIKLSVDKDHSIDLYSTENIYLPPRKSVSVSTGISIELPKKYIGIIFIKDSLLINNNLQLSNGIGVINCNNIGELVIPVFNHDKQTHIIKEGESFAKMIVLPIYNYKLI